MVARLSDTTRSCVLAITCCSRSAHAGWSVRIVRNGTRRPSTGVEHRQIVAGRERDRRAGDTGSRSLFQKSATLRVIDNPTGENDLATLMQREECLAGVNGGYFDPENKPVGLCSSDGRPDRSVAEGPPAQRSADRDQNGQVQLLRSTEYSGETKNDRGVAMRSVSGRSGQPVPGLNDTRSARRTFICRRGRRSRRASAFVRE